jgi:phasin family protein
MSTAHTTHQGHKAEAGTKPEVPTVNISELLERFKVPGIDLPALVEAQRKNVEALREANQKAYSGALALAQRQAEIFEKTMHEWQATAKELIAKSSAENTATKQADLARKAIENALANMRELAEMAAKSQAEAYEVIGKRVKTGLAEFQDYLKKHS